MLSGAFITCVVLIIVCNIREAVAGCSSQQSHVSPMSITGVTDAYVTATAMQGGTESISRYRSVGYYPVSGRWTVREDKLRY
jgi:hypothetical protein